MVDEKTIEAVEKLISKADTWGDNSMSLVLLTCLLVVVAFFMWYIMIDFKKAVASYIEAVNEYTQSNKELIKELTILFNSSISEIKNKQNEIHLDIKELIHTHRYGFSYEPKGYRRNEE